MGASSQEKTVNVKKECMFATDQWVIRSTELWFESVVVWWESVLLDVSSIQGCAYREVQVYTHTTNMHTVSPVLFFIPCCACIYSKLQTVEYLYKDTPELRTPLKKDTFLAQL